MMHATVQVPVRQELPGEYQRLREALLTDHNGLLTATLARLARLARARGVESSAIDDVVQETLLEGWSHLHRLTFPAGFPAWIDEICRNVCRRHARRRQRESRRTTVSRAPFLDADPLSGEQDVFPLSNIADTTLPDPLEECSRQELAVLLDRALGLLPQETRQLVEMCHLLELPHSEIAERLGISVGTLQTRLHRARRQLLQLLRGPLYQDAASFSPLAEQEEDGQWLDTRLWCSLCGRRLQGSFVECESEGKRSVNLHVRCPGCARQHGMDEVHSMGLVSLGNLRSFKPAWKRTLQGFSELILPGLSQGGRPCPWCGSPTSVRVADAEETSEDTPTLGPYRFWIRWWCARCGEPVGLPGDLPSVEQVVSWSDVRSREFILRHPHWQSALGLPIEYDGQAALQFHLTDGASTESLRIFAHRETLRVLAVYDR
jgi:RNA polymerase sigma-70 factor (ECF subfamily)